jgi:hypothetical protein
MLCLDSMGIRALQLSGSIESMRGSTCMPTRRKLDRRRKKENCSDMTERACCVSIRSLDHCPEGPRHIRRAQRWPFRLSIDIQRDVCLASRRATGRHRPCLEAVIRAYSMDKISSAKHSASQHTVALEPGGADGTQTGSIDIAHGHDTYPKAAP